MSGGDTNYLIIRRIILEIIYLERFRYKPKKENCVQGWLKYEDTPFEGVQELSDHEWHSLLFIISLDCINLKLINKTKRRSSK